MIFIWRIFYIRRHKIGFFLVSLLVFVFSILLLTLRNRLVVVFLGWEGLGVASFILIIFYQNWIRSKGGLLTLLTNRLGDIILLVTLCGLLRKFIGELESNIRILLILAFLILALTKRAQWPFIRWLPAAIAAPTPVRALVHSSTLVTAGVWLIIRFSSRTSFNIVIWGALGIITLLVARFSALIETDAKKMVALSTLSQLGLMFIALALGIPMICYFHILIHALAKANLFIVVGRLLHTRFSQQDSRIISSGTIGPLFTISIITRLLRLVGFVFIAGFFSKEQILIGQPFLLNRVVSWIMMFLISRLTLAYCLKLFWRVLSLNPERVFQSSFIRLTQSFPVFFIRILTVIMGFIFNFNLNLSSFFLRRKENIYWIMRLLGLLILPLRKSRLKFCYSGFYIQTKIIDLIIIFLAPGKVIMSKLEASRREIIFLVTRYSSINLMKQSIRLVFLLSVRGIFFYLL